MARDDNYVSQEDHEIIYLLRKWKKKQNNKNIEFLKSSLKEFKKCEGYQPHTREDFYRFVNVRYIKKYLENT